MHRSQPIIILGMHRSGTSLLAGMLQRAGLYLGDVLNRSIPLNPTGLQEPKAVLYMHEDLLEKSGGAWHEPPEKVHWQRLHEAVRDLFIESRHAEPIWGFKDPRTLLVLDGWLKVLPTARCAGIFRHPADVALSISRRNGFSMEKSLKLWETYNRRLLDYHSRLAFPIVEFDAERDRMRPALERIAQWIEPSWTCDADFFDPAHYRNIAKEVDLPPSIRVLYEDLRGAAAA